MGLTYGWIAVSATLFNVWSDVGKSVLSGLSMSISCHCGPFHTWRQSGVESLQYSAKTADTAL